MIRRPTPLTALVSTAVAALALSACGGDGSPGPKGTVAGADTADEPSASPSLSEPAAGDRPRLTMPSDLSYTFDWPKTGDPDKDAVLADSEESIKAVDLAIVHQDPLDKAYLYYYEGEAAAGTQEFIQNYVDHKAAITGRYRFYDPEVTVEDDTTASLTYCEDQGKAFVKYLDTNKVKKTEVTAASYVSYRTSLKKNADGVWKVREISSRSGSDKCRP